MLVRIKSSSSLLIAQSCVKNVWFYTMGLKVYVRREAAETENANDAVCLSKYCLLYRESGLVWN